MGFINIKAYHLGEDFLVHFFQAAWPVANEYKFFLHIVFRLYIYIYVFIYYIYTTCFSYEISQEVNTTIFNAHLHCP